jgi:hypothetical protein
MRRSRGSVTKGQVSSSESRTFCHTAHRKLHREEITIVLREVSLRWMLNGNAQSQDVEGNSD